MGIQRRELGNTGERLSIVGMGGRVLLGMEQRCVNDLVCEAVDRGVNYFDVAPSYGDGEAEEKLGEALKPHRDRAFLACKTMVRDRAGAAQELRASLSRLQVDHFDLYQFHCLETRGDVKAALGRGGAIEALLEARDKGLIRFLGFSAHTEEAALLAMKRFRFDTVLFPINWVCVFQQNLGPKVLKEAEDLGMGRLAIKAMARTRWPKDVEHDYPNCWYEPGLDFAEARMALRFTLSQSITAAVPPGDEDFFRLAMSVAEGYEPISAEEEEKLRTLSTGIKPIFDHRDRSLRGIAHRALHLGKGKKL